MKKIYEITKCLSGNVLGIGVDAKISKILKENDLVLNCNLLNSDAPGENEKSKKKYLKKIKIKKIRKVFKKKKIDFIICNVIEIKKNLKTFIKDSVYINKKILYIYGITDTDLKTELIKKYSRYNTKIEIINDNNDIILKIDNSNAKTNKIKDITYLIIDTLINMINIISDILLN
ncbi:MAG: hypothetical protein J6D28_01645 [Bacilli bacterium]|nr:hypothetical protein [Bacilli bacterium]